MSDSYHRPQNPFRVRFELKSPAYQSLITSVSLFFDVLSVIWVISQFAIQHLEWMLLAQ